MHRNSTIVSTKQERIAGLAKQSPQMAFTSLAYLMDMDWLKEAYQRTRKDGAVGVDGVGKDIIIDGMATDIDELKRGAEELRSLTRQLLVAQDSERRRIARDLHDSTAQNLAAVALNIDRVLRLATDIAVPLATALQES